MLQAGTYHDGIFCLFKSPFQIRGNVLYLCGVFFHRSHNRKPRSRRCRAINGGAACRVSRYVIVSFSVHEEIKKREGFVTLKVCYDGITTFPSKNKYHCYIKNAYLLYADIPLDECVQPIEEVDEPICVFFPLSIQFIHLSFPFLWNNNTKNKTTMMDMKSSRCHIFVSITCIGRYVGESVCFEIGGAGDNGCPFLQLSVCLVLSSCLLDCQIPTGSHPTPPSYI